MGLYIVHHGYSNDMSKRGILGIPWTPWMEGAIEQRGAQVDREHRRLCKYRVVGKIKSSAILDHRTRTDILFSVFLDFWSDSSEGYIMHDTR
jgi:hypothetical protein